MPSPVPSAPPRARITQRFWLNSTHGRVEYRQTGCGRQRWPTPRAETVRAAQAATRIALGGRVELTGPGVVGGPPMYRRSLVAERMAGGSGDVLALWSERLSV